MMQKCTSFLTVAVAVVVFLVGCSNGLFGPVSSNSGVNDLLVTIWLSNPCPQVGDTIWLRATVDNTGTTTEVVDIKDKAILDIEIALESKMIRWSDDKPLTSELTHLELAPGQSKTIEMDWVVSEDSSRYHVVYAVFTVHTDPPIIISRPGVPLTVGSCLMSY